MRFVPVLVVLHYARLERAFKTMCFLVLDNSENQPFLIGFGSILSKSDDALTSC
jgi:hypothetical protein